MKVYTKFTTLFIEMYKSYFLKKKVYLSITEQELEEVLKNYIKKVMGPEVITKYEDFREREQNKIVEEEKITHQSKLSSDDNNDNFPYYASIRRWFVNLIQNFDFNKSRTLVDAINEYGSNFNPTISNYFFVDKLITGAKKLYSYKKDDPNVIIEHKGKMYKIGLIDDKDSNESMPTMVINNIDKLNDVLRLYFDAVILTDNRYKKIFEGVDETNRDDVLTELFMWTLMNISNDDALDLERFFLKYSSFLCDDTFEVCKEHVKYLGDILNDKLYLLERKSSCAYETPYYLAFMLCNRRVELPNIRLGIEDTGEDKVAHILSIQSTQSNPNIKEDPIVNKEIKEQLPKSANFREFNPSHLLSLVLTIGLLHGAGINKINAYGYLPMRYQRFINEGRKNDDELHDYQHRLTNKFINTFFRLMEFTDDIEVISYPDNGGTIILKLNDNVHFNNELLDKAYQIGFEQKESLNNYYQRLSQFQKRQI